MPLISDHQGCVQCGYKVLFLLAYVVVCQFINMPLCNTIQSPCARAVFAVVCNVGQRSAKSILFIICIVNRVLSHFMNFNLRSQSNTGLIYITAVLPLRPDQFLKWSLTATDSILMKPIILKVVWDINAPLVQ